MIDEAQLVPFQPDILPSSQGPWLVFAPHADDETFGMGGTIALASSRGIAVELAVVTDGALGGTGDKHKLILSRQAEARRAAQVLGIREVHFLGQPDRGLENSPPVQNLVSSLIRSTGCTTVFFPGPLEFHPDHRSCAVLVWDSCSKLQHPSPELISYEITVQSPANCLIDITSTRDIKARALDVYLSQLTENNYTEVVKGLNVLRTLTLGSQVAAAEGFYRYSAQERSGSLQQWLINWASRLLLD